MGRLVSIFFVISGDLAANGISAEPCAYEWERLF
jgi:hypothetical protein